MVKSLGVYPEISCVKRISEIVVPHTGSIVVAIKCLGLEKEDKTKALQESITEHLLREVATMLTTFHTRSELIQTDNTTYLNRTPTAFVKEPRSSIIAVCYYKCCDITAKQWVQATHTLCGNTGNVLDIDQVNLKEFKLEIICGTAPCIVIKKSCHERIPANHVCV